MKFDAGELRERITIQRATVTPDDVGGQSRAWYTLRTVWAKVTSGQQGRSAGREVIEAEALTGVNSYRIIVRKTDVTWQDRLIWRGDTLSISSVSFLDPQRSLMLIAAEHGVGT